MDARNGSSDRLLGRGGAAFATLWSRPSVRGRKPAWSPDGLRIAYEDHGAVRVAHLKDADGNGQPGCPRSGHVQSTPSPVLRRRMATTDSEPADPLRGHRPGVVTRRHRAGRGRPARRGARPVRHLRPAPRRHRTAHRRAGPRPGDRAGLAALRRPRRHRHLDGHPAGDRRVGHLDRDRHQHRSEPGSGRCAGPAGRRLDAGDHASRMHIRWFGPHLPARDAETGPVGAQGSCR